MSYAVAVGEDEGELVRGVQRGEGLLEIDHSDVAGVGVGLAAFAPPGARQPGGASAPESFAFYGGLSALGLRVGRPLAWSCGVRLDGGPRRKL